MKKILTMLAACLAVITASAQTKAEILVSYDARHTNMYGKDIVQKMTLLASPAEAKYFNDLSQWVDSLKSTPEGTAQYMEIIKKSCMSVGPDGVMTLDMRKGPTKTVHCYVLTNQADQSLTVYDKFGDEMGYYSEPLDEMDWTIVEDSTATFLGYDCLLAETDYHGRKWRAWFAPEIPLSFGPWKLHGLPGLILRAEADGGFSFGATGLEQTDRVISPIYLLQKYNKVDRKKALEDAEYRINNMESLMNAGGTAVKIYSVDDDGNPIETPKYDGRKHNLEPDYK